MSVLATHSLLQGLLHLRLEALLAAGTCSAWHSAARIYEVARMLSPYSAVQTGEKHRPVQGSTSTSRSH